LAATSVPDWRSLMTEIIAKVLSHEVLVLNG
jgi:hypothetical protein